MNKITVEVIEPEDIRPETGDLVQGIEYPEYFYFVSGRGNLDGNKKESCHTTNASIIKGKLGIWNGYGTDEDFKIVMRNGKPFEYPAPNTDTIKLRIDGKIYTAKLEENE